MAKPVMKSFGHNRFEVLEAKADEEHEVELGVIGYGSVLFLPTVKLEHPSALVSQATTRPSRWPRQRGAVWFEVDGELHPQPGRSQDLHF